MFCQPSFGEEDLRKSRLDGKNYFKEKLLQPTLWNNISLSKAAQSLPSPYFIQQHQQQLTNSNNYCNDEKYVRKSPISYQQQQVNLLQQQLKLKLQQQDNFYQQEILKQQYLQLLNQRHQLAVASADQEDNYAINNDNNKRNEISKSLQIFAARLSAACELNSSGDDLTKHSDNVRQDFADNGYINDNFNDYQLQQQTSNCYINNSIKHQRHSQGANTHFPNYFNYTYKKKQNSIISNILPPTKRSNKKSSKSPITKHCVFCENNNEPEAVIKSHTVRDVFGRVLCPKLRSYICPICKASGDVAHTIKYCPKKPIITMEDAIKAESFRLTKATFFKQKMKI